MGNGPEIPNPVRTITVAARFSLPIGCPVGPTHMSIRIRKLIGTVLLFILVTAWALLVMALAQSALTDTNFWVATLFYAVAGLGWVLPAMPLVRWMLRPDR
jgi:uncharacterized protein DUF2842